MPPWQTIILPFCLGKAKAIHCLCLKKKCNRGRSMDKESSWVLESLGQREEWRGFDLPNPPLKERDLRRIWNLPIADPGKLQSPFKSQYDEYLLQKKYIFNPSNSVTTSLCFLTYSSRSPGDWQGSQGSESAPGYMLFYIPTIIFSCFF